jgi:hypothetical protein
MAETGNFLELSESTRHVQPQSRLVAPSFALAPMEHLIAILIQLGGSMPKQHLDHGKAVELLSGVALCSILHNCMPVG